MPTFDYTFLKDDLLPAQLVSLTSNIFSLRTMMDIRKEQNSAAFVELEDLAKIESIKASKEAARIQALSMTRSDFFDGMIMAFGLDSKELRVIVENVLEQINITPVQIRVALNNYDNALNFYRKHTLFTLINNVQIPISETNIQDFD